MAPVHVHRRDGDPLDLNGDTPMWLRATYRLGLPIVISVFLIWFLTQTLAGSLHELAQDHKDQAYYLRAICINVSKTDTDRALCQPPQPMPSSTR